MDQQTIAKELEQLLNRDSSINIPEIASWAYKARLDSLREVDRSVLDILEELGAMDMGPEFEWTETELRGLVSTLKR